VSRPRYRAQPRTIGCSRNSNAISGRDQNRCWDGGRFAWAAASRHVPTVIPMLVTASGMSTGHFHEKTINGRLTMTWYSRLVLNIAVETGLA
jgi:hypothetical protein